MTRRDSFKGQANDGPTVLECREALEKYGDKVPSPKNMADVVVMFAKIKDLYPNALLHCSPLGSREKNGFSLVSAFPVDVNNEANRMNVDMDEPMFDSVRGNRRDPIADKDEMVMQMLHAQFLYICKERGFDPVKSAKVLWKAMEKMRRETGLI